MTEIDNPWDGEAERLIREHNATQQVARDLIVLEYLREGDTRALAHWMMQDYCPGIEVRRFLSLMLAPERVAAEDPNVKVEVPRDLVPYVLHAKRRGGGKGRRRNLVSEERDRALRELYDANKSEAGKGSSDGVVLEMAEQLGPYIRKSAIREAIKSRSKKR